MSTSTHERRPFNLSRWAIGHPSIARFLFGLIIIAGALGLMRMGQKEDPDFTFRVMVVQAVWPGSSIQEMEDQVVNKIERKLQETPHLDFVRSFTRAGSAIITVQIKGDTNAAEVADAFCFRSPWQRLFKILLPAAMPGILVGFRTALGQAWMAVVAAEIFGVAGVGQRMMQASSLLATDIVVVYMLTMAALYGLLDTAFVAFQGWVLRWKA